MIAKGSKILITGAAGFIGFHLANRLCGDGQSVVGIDNLNSYYDVDLKKARLQKLKVHQNFSFQKIDLIEETSILELFKKHRFDYVVNLAAQAGVRYSLQNPKAYIDSNIIGFLNVLEACRKYPVKHLTFASSSSVYGANTKMPFSTSDNVDHPIALYGVTKKSNELMAHTYSHLFQIPCTGLRFFTVYGPWGRPDMALFKFTKGILEEEPIDVYNNGRMKRDFTFVDDIVEGIFRLLPNVPQQDPNWNSQSPNPSTSYCRYRLFNIGNNKPVELEHFINVLETSLGKKAIKNYQPIQPGDVPETYADIRDLQKLTGFQPKISIEEGIPKFVEWYKSYY